MLIGLMGPMRSGKTTGADALVTEGFIKTSFAAPLKEMVLDCIPDWNRDHIYGELKGVVDPRYGFSPRQLMQHLGTECFRALNPNFWIDRAQDWINWSSNNEPIVYDDVRFINEAKFIKNNNGILIRVIPNAFPWDFPIKHLSEFPINDSWADHMIINRYTKKATFQEEIKCLCLQS